MLLFNQSIQHTNAARSCEILSFTKALAETRITNKHIPLEPKQPTQDTEKASLKNANKAQE